MECRHNTLVNYYRSKAKRSFGIPINDLEDILYSNDDPAEIMIEAEMINKLQNEIAYLSKIQRRIIILYYYEGKKQRDIADILSIPVGTVKWHLFNAKQEMRKGMETMRNVSELKFNPIKFTLMGLSGSVGTMGGTSNFFRSVLSQNIAYCTYHEPKTINEIAESLGVSPVYVESEADFLENYGFLIKKDDKYLANMIIDEPDNDTFEIVRLQEEMYTKAAKLISCELFDELMKSDLLASDRIYYPDEDKNFLIWGLLLYLLAWSNEGFNEKIKFDEVATIRKDGGKNIANAGFEKVNGPKRKYIESMQKWHGPMWNGLANGMFKLAVIWLKDEAIKQQLIGICNKIRIKHKEELELLKNRYCKVVIENTPKHVQKMQTYGLQYIFYSDGWFLLYSVKELLKCGKLKLPADQQRLSLSTLIMPNS